MVLFSVVLVVVFLLLLFFMDCFSFLLLVVIVIWLVLSGLVLLVLVLLLLNQVDGFIQEWFGLLDRLYLDVRVLVKNKKDNCLIDIEYFWFMVKGEKVGLILWECFLVG